MSKAVEVIDSITNLIKTLADGFGFFEFLVVVLIVFGIFAWANPVALASLVESMISFLPTLKGATP